MFKFIAFILASVGITYFLTDKQARNEIATIRQNHSVRMEEYRRDLFDRTWQEAYYRGIMDTQFHGMTVDKYLKKED